MSTLSTIFTGIKPYWSFDKFEINSRTIGGGTAFINTCGGQVDIIDEEEVVVLTNMNLIFMSTDIILKYFDNSPYLTRFWNSTESLNSDYFINAHFGLMGRHWWTNFEHCLIEDTGNSVVMEIDPSGARHRYDDAGSGNYNSPSGILKTLTKSSNEFDLEDRSGTVWHFKALTSDESNVYRLDYIKSRNDNRIYVTWELKDANPSGVADNKYRIASISVCNGSDTTALTTFLEFEYINKTISNNHYHFVTSIKDYEEDFTKNIWLYEYDDDGNLLKVTYPTGEWSHVYGYDGSNRIDTITDMNTHDWNIDWNAPGWSVSVNSAPHTTTYDWKYDQTGPNGWVICDKLEPSTAVVWRYKHQFALTGTPGPLYEFTIPDNHLDIPVPFTRNYPYRFTWSDNQLTRLDLPYDIEQSYSCRREYTYDASGNLTNSKFHDGTAYNTKYTHDFAYDAFNRLIWEGKDLQSGTYPTAVYFTKTEYTYDTLGNLILTRVGINEGTDDGTPPNASLDLVTTYAYDLTNGNLESITSPSGFKTTFFYNEYGSITKITYPGDFTLVMAWDARSMYLTSMTDEDTYTRYFEYDVMGQLGVSEDPLSNQTIYKYDGNGNIKNLALPESPSSTMDYDEKNRLVQASSPDNVKVLNTYDDRDDLTKIEKSQDGTTCTTDLTYDDSHRLIQLTVKVTENGSLVSKNHVFTYDSNSRIVSYTDPGSNITSFEYDDAISPGTPVYYGNLWHITYPVVYKVGRSGNTYSKLVEERRNEGPMGLLDRVRRLHYEDAGSDPTTLVDSEGEYYQYDRAGRLIFKETSPDYDFEGTPSDGDKKYREIYNLNPEGWLIALESSQWEYDSGTEEWNCLFNKATLYEYDDRGNLIKQSDPVDSGSIDGGKTYDTSYEYNGRRQRVKVDVGGLVTREYTYDENGRQVAVTSISDAWKLTDKFQYDAKGNLVASIDGNGNVTSYGYDSDNRITSITDGEGRTTLRKYYSDSGRLWKIIYPNGDYIQYAYDQMGRITNVYEYPGGTSYGQSTTLAAAITLQVKYSTGAYQFDGAGTAFTEANENVEFRVLKSGGDYVQAFSTDKNGRIRYYHFYDNGNAARYYEYLYDAYGNLTNVKKPDGNYIEYEYDKLNRMTKEILDPGVSQNYNEFTYQFCSSRLTNFTQTEGGVTLQPTSYTYDFSGRLLTEGYTWESNTSTHATTTHTFGYRYDPAGRRARMSDPYWSTHTSGQASTPYYNHYFFDSIGRLQITNRAREVSEVYGAYTKKAPWAGKTWLNSGGCESYVTEFDPGGRPVRLTYPGEFNEAAVDVVYVYNNANQLTSITCRDLTGTEPEEIYVIAYGYDKKGRKVKQTVWDSTGDSHPQYEVHYAYDYRDQLTGETYKKFDATTDTLAPWRMRTYTYDTGGSMTEKKIFDDSDWVTHTFTYSRGYHITTWGYVMSDTANGSVLLSYDTNGNLTQHSALTGGVTLTKFDLVALTLTYDRKNRLSTYRFATDPIRTLKWDALGRIREKTWTENSTDYKQVFYHDGRTLMQIWNETEDGNDVTREISYDLFNGQTGYQKDIDFDADPDVESYLIKDEQGTVRAAVKLAYSSGSYTVTTNRYYYDAYGAWLNPASVPTDTHYMKYISGRVEGYGDETAQNQALVHLDHRHYLPYLGVFLQREPLMVWGAEIFIKTATIKCLNLNSYRYSLNLPTIYSDPTGLASRTCYDKYNNECKPDYRECMSCCLEQALAFFDDMVDCALHSRAIYKERIWKNRALAAAGIIALTGLALISIAFLPVGAVIAAGLIGGFTGVAITVMGFDVSFENAAEAARHKNCIDAVRCAIIRYFEVDFQNCMDVTCLGELCTCLGECADCPELDTSNDGEPKLNFFMVSNPKIICCVGIARDYTGYGCKSLSSCECGHLPIWSPTDDWVWSKAPGHEERDPRPCGGSH